MKPTYCLVYTLSMKTFRNLRIGMGEMSRTITQLICDEPVNVYKRIRELLYVVNWFITYGKVVYCISYDHRNEKEKILLFCF
jgi:hypothetical protein